MRVLPLALLTWALLLGAPRWLQAQQPTPSADQLRVNLTSTLFDSLAAVSASVSQDGRQVLLEMVDSAVSTIEAEGLTRDRADEAVLATEIFAGRLIARARRPDGSVRLGEMTRSYISGICPLWPFC